MKYGLQFRIFFSIATLREKKPLIMMMLILNQSSSETTVPECLQTQTQTDPLWGHFCRDYDFTIYWIKMFDFARAKCSDQVAMLMEVKNN